MNWEVGQSVFVVDTMRPNAPITYDAKITKVGRKWAQLEPSHLGRFDLSNGEVDAGGYHRSQKVWRSEGEYRAFVKRRRRWARVCDAASARWQVPAHITDNDLSDLERILRVSPDPT